MSSQDNPQNPSQSNPPKPVPMPGLIQKIIFDPLPIISICSTPDDNIVACSYSEDSVNRRGEVYIFDRDFNELYKKQLSSACFHMDFYWESDTAALKLADGKIALFRINDKKLEYEGIDNENVMITDCAFNFPTLDEITFVDSDGFMKRYDRSTQTIVSSVKAHVFYKTTVSGWCVDYIDNNVVMSGGDDCTLKIWDKRNDKPTTTVEMFNGGVVRIRKSKADQFYTGSYDNTLRLLDIRNLSGSVNKVELEGNPWDFNLYSNGHLSVAAMYSGFYLLRSDLSIAYHQPLPGSLAYGINVDKTSDKLRLHCASFKDFTVFQFDLDQSQGWTVPPLEKPALFNLMFPE